MTRLKKSRKATGFINDRGPSRKERLADPDSYDSRKRRAQEQKKKHISVYEKQRQAEKDDASQSDERKTRLADKIRKLNQQKEESSE